MKYQLWTKGNKNLFLGKGGGRVGVRGSPGGHGLGCVLGSLLALWGVGGKHLIAVLREEELRPRTQASLG